MIIWIIEYKKLIVMISYNKLFECKKFLVWFVCISICDIIIIKFFWFRGKLKDEWFKDVKKLVGEIFLVKMIL